LPTGDLAEIPKIGLSNGTFDWLDFWLATENKSSATFTNLGAIYASNSNPGYGFALLDLLAVVTKSRHLQEEENLEQTQPESTRW
jgi:hypothetical protein